MAKTALITGITGQDGAYLARFLLGKDYVVHGLRPYAATDDLGRLDGLTAHPNLHFHYGDLTDQANLIRVIDATRPDEIYNLGAMSHVAVSFDSPEATANINALGTLRLLEAIRILRLSDTARFYQASSSEMFGNAPGPQNEDTVFAPCSPYGTAKLFGYWTVRNYRDSYGMHASNGILFNHESPLRGEKFVTRKIAQAVVQIKENKLDTIRIGNLAARRDWGFAGDYVEGMWLMLQQEKPDDYVLATGQSWTVRQFIEAAFSCVNMSIDWTGAGLDERGICRATGRTLVAVDPTFFRPNEVHDLIGDASKARAALGWRPRTGFMDLVRMMVEAEHDTARTPDAQSTPDNIIPLASHVRSGS